MPLESVVVETGSSNNYSVYIQCTHERESPKRRRNLSSQRKSEISITSKKARRTDRKVTENSTFRVSRSTGHGHGLSSRFSKHFWSIVSCRYITPVRNPFVLQHVLAHNSSTRLPEFSQHQKKLTCTLTLPSLHFHLTHPPHTINTLSSSLWPPIWTRFSIISNPPILKQAMRTYEDS